MAQSSIYCTFPQNPPLGGKDKLASAAPIKGNNTSVLSSPPTSTVAPPVISALTFLAQYLEDNLQQLLKIVLDFRPPAPPSAPAPAP